MQTKAQNVQRIPERYYSELSLRRSDEKRASARGRPIVAPHTGPHTPPYISFAYRSGGRGITNMQFGIGPTLLAMHLSPHYRLRLGARMKRETYNTFSRPPTQATATSWGRLIAVFLTPRIRKDGRVTNRAADSTLAVSLAQSLSLSLTPFSRAKMLGARKDGRLAVTFGEELVILRPLTFFSRPGRRRWNGLPGRIAVDTLLLARKRENGNYVVRGLSSTGARQI